MRKFIAIVLLALPIPALADTAAPSPETRALDAMLNACGGREFMAVRQAFTAKEQIDVLQKQVADLTKERDELKAAKP